MRTQVPTGLKIESGESPEPALGCARGRKPYFATGNLLGFWEGAVSRLIWKSEDLPEKVIS